MVLRQRADKMDRKEILDRYTVVNTVEQLIEVYAPLVTDIRADYISVQIASLDSDTVIKRVGTEVLPELRKLAE